MSDQAGMCECGHGYDRHEMLPRETLDSDMPCSDCRCIDFRPVSDQPQTCGRCKGRKTITYYPPRRDGAYPIPCPDCAEAAPVSDQARLQLEALSEHFADEERIATDIIAAVNDEGSCPLCGVRSPSCWHVLWAEGVTTAGEHLLAALREAERQRDEWIGHAATAADVKDEALSKPCAECGHIDWRSDPNPLLERVDAAERRAEEIGKRYDDLRGAYARLSTESSRTISSLQAALASEREAT